MRRSIIGPSYLKLNTSSSIGQRTYASFSDTITVEANQIARLLQEPHLIAGVRTIRLSTSNSWPKWDDLSDREHGGMLEHEQKCKAELPQILKALDSAPTIDKAILSFKDVANLPIWHWRSQKRNDMDIPNSRTPVTIFQSMSIRCACQDVGLWTFDDFPKIDINDELTRFTLSIAREFASESSGGKNSWHAFVSERQDPVFQAFDYTADFHSRDLTTSDELTGLKDLIDLGPMGQGYYRLEGEDMDDFSEKFVCDLESNVKYFRENDDEWQPNLYEQFRRGDREVVSSNLNTIDRSKAKTIKVSRPIWELSESMLERLRGMLKCGDEEEIVFGKNSLNIKKKKKKKV